MPRSASPSGQPLLATMASARPTFRQGLFDGRVQEDDPIWKEYVEEAAASDTRMVENWNKILDVILVFIALFISAMIPFVIETSKEFDRSPAEMTNDILIALYNKPANGSSLNISNFRAENRLEYGKAIFSNRLLYASLALSIVISMIAMTARVWLVRYTYWVSSPGSRYDQAMRRQEAFSGLKAWGLGTLIDFLPLLVLIAVYLFGLYVHVSVGKQVRGIGYMVGTIFFGGLTCLFGASFSAAFIPSSPFRSCISDIVAFLFNSVFPRAKIPKKLRNSIILGTFIVAAFFTTFLVLKKNPTYQVIIFYPLACVFAVAERTKRKVDYSPWCKLPWFTLMLGIIIFPLMAVASWYNTRPPVFIGLSVTSFVAMALAGFIVSRLTKFIPDTREAEAITWLLERSPSKTSTFKKAVQIANTKERKVLLLNALLPLLPDLITSRLRSQHGELERRELEIYVSSLAHLSDFSDSESQILQNAAAVEHPTLPLTIMAQLEGLRNHQNPLLRDAAETVWRNYGVQGWNYREENGSMV